MIRRSIVFIGALLVGGARIHLSAANEPDFTRDVRPILSRHCFKCHGPDEAARKSKLRLDLRESALQPAKSGGVAIVPGRPKDSALVQRITSPDSDEIMPPASTRNPLTSAEQNILVRWIAAGAEYRPHWAFAPPKQPRLPEVKRAEWVVNPIDRFTLARLEAEGLAPSPPADRFTLARRVSLDLIGLPPTPEAANAFANDPSPNAYEHLVDSLLASPHYGERWGRRWMDLARYADTNGYEKDRPRSIWPWRDWVINALNADMPFDQFTIEQLAGDLLPDATVDQLIATGFHRNTMLNEEGGIDPLEFRYLASTDRVNTTGTTWLGLTVSCAQCHTHKYDPIPHREYFQMMAFLNNANEPDLDLPQPDADVRRRAELAKANQLLAELPNRFPVPDVEWQTPKPMSAIAESGEEARLLEDGSALFAGKAPDHDTYTIVVETALTNITTLRLEALIDSSLPSKGPGRVKHGNFVLGEITVTAAPRTSPSQAQSIKLSRPQADVEQSGLPIAHAVDGKSETGWGVDVGGGKLNANHAATFAVDPPIGFPEGTRFVIRLEQPFGHQHLIGRPRLSFGRPIPDPRPVALRRAEILDRRFTEWLAEKRSWAAVWKPLRPRQLKSNSPLLTVQSDESVLASGDITKSDTYELMFAPGGVGITAVRLEALPDERLPRHGPGMAYYEGPKGDFFMGEIQISVGGQPVKLARASHSYAKNNFGSNASAQLAIDGDPQTGWSTAGREGERHEAVFVLSEPIAATNEWQVKMLFGRHYACSIGRFRISVTDHPGGAHALDLPEDVGKLLTYPDSQLTAADTQSLREHFLLALPELAEPAGEIRRHRLPAATTTTMVLRERPPENPRPTFRHNRGEYLQPAERVEPDVLSAVSPFPPNLPRNRLGFARWLVTPENPLTARVTVNRQWQAFFGRGLVRTTEDFGFQGEVPSHPELLDWLAVEFIRQGWSLKMLHRRIVLSATYQQGSRVTPEQLEKDPENRLLGRGPRSRLEAELIRDLVLSASGLLAEKMGGPSVHPPQPAGVTEVAYGSPSWPTSSGEGRYRRGVYTFMKRAAPFALFNTFDAPTGEACIARREVSNTPLQALTLLNDVLLVEASRAMGRLLLARGGSVEASVRYAFRRCATRPATDEEVAALLRFFETQHRRLAAGELDAKAISGDNSANATELAAWVALARAILNLDETITKG